MFAPARREKEGRKRALVVVRSTKQRKGRKGRREVVSSLVVLHHAPLKLTFCELLHDSKSNPTPSTGNQRDLS